MRDKKECAKYSGDKQTLQTLVASTKPLTDKLGTDHTRVGSVGHPEPTLDEVAKLQPEALRDFLKRIGPSAYDEVYNKHLNYAAAEGDELYFLEEMYDRDPRAAGSSMKYNRYITDTTFTMDELHEGALKEHTKRIQYKIVQNKLERIKQSENHNRVMRRKKKEKMAKASRRRNRG